MKLPRRQFLQLAAGVAVLSILSISLSGHGAWSQATRTIKIVVPFPPGGSADIMSRLLAEQVSRAQDVTMVIENRPGGGAVIATEAVSRAAPDGNTVLYVGNSFLINPNLKKVNYDPLTSFEPICFLTGSSMGIMVSQTSPYRTLTDLLTTARLKPGELTLASTGPAVTQHIAFEVLKRAANVNMTYVPYPGDVPAINALLGGHVTAVLSTSSSAMEQIKAGKLRALATTSRTRAEELPDVPTVAEFGFKDYEADIMNGLVAPARTPKEIVSQLGNWFLAALQVLEVKAKLTAVGQYSVGMCGADFAVHLRKRYDGHGRLIREANIKLE
jgi:tripartite-type tricarboxylate transporter receptor subunit TctC